MLEAEKEENLEGIFPCTYYNITVFQYNVYRILIALGFVLTGLLIISKTLIVLGVLVYFLLLPKEEVKGIKTPFHFIKSFVMAIDKDKKDEELVVCLILLKNMTLQFENDSKRADYIIEILKDSVTLTKPAFIKFLNYYRMNQKMKGAEIFCREIGTDLANDLSKLFLEMDDLKLSDIKISLASVQNTVTEIKNTKKYEKNGKISDLCMIPIIANLIIIALDYVMVTFYISEISYKVHF